MCVMMSEVLSLSVGSPDCISLLCVSLSVIFSNRCTLEMTWFSDTVVIMTGSVSDQ